MTFSGKRKSVSSKTSPFCQGLSLWESWRRRRLRGQARQNKTRKHSDTMSLTNRACIAVFLLFGSILALSVCSADTSPKVRGFGIPQRFREIPETDKIPETPANATGTVILIYPTRVCFARVSRHKFVTFCWWGAQTFGGIYWAISTRNG